MTNYDPKLDMDILVDGSPVGLGAILSQKDRPHMHMQDTPQVVRIAHAGHQGISKTKAFIRSNI